MISDNNKFNPLRMTQKDCKNTMDLLLFEQDGKSHYSLVKHFNRLFRSQSTSRTNGTILICKKCFTHFTKQELFEKQISYCSTNETVAVKMPAGNTTIKFKNNYKQHPIPFVVYADFECLTKPLSTCEPYPHNSYTYSYQKHEPSGFCLYLKGLDILGDPGAVSRAGRNSATKVFKYRRKSPWVPTLTGPFPNGQANAGS